MRGWEPPTLDPLPFEVEFVKRYSDGLCLVACQHPPELRRRRTGGYIGDLCLLCKGDDMSRKCLMRAKVPEAALQPTQRGLF